MIILNFILLTGFRRIIVTLLDCSIFIAMILATTTTQYIYGFGLNLLLLKNIGLIYKRSIFYQLNMFNGLKIVFLLQVIIIHLLIVLLNYASRGLYKAILGYLRVNFLIIHDWNRHIFVGHNWNQHIFVGHNWIGLNIFFIGHHNCIGYLQLTVGVL